MKYKGGHKVGKGTYWNLSNGNRVDIAAEGMLPGDGNAIYLRVPPGIVLLAGPVIGLFYVIALPFIAVGTIAVALGGKLGAGLLDLLGCVISFGWRPREANLTGKKREKDKEPK